MALKDNFKAFRLAKHWSQARVAMEAEVSQQLISQIENGDPSAGKDKLPQIAAALGCEVTDLDPTFWKEHPAAKAVSAAVRRRPQSSAFSLPLFASARGGEAEMIVGDSRIEDVRHPLENVPGAYAVYIVGDSMEPLFEQGDKVLVNPHVPPRPGSDVILQGPGAEETGERAAMVKRLVRAGATEWQLEQFNPPKKFKEPFERFPTCHVIVGKYSRR